MRKSLVLLALTLAGCSTSSTYSGTIVDAMSGKPRGELRVIAKSEGATDLTCMAKEATADAQGAFTIQGLCGDMEYQLSLSDETLMIEGATTVTGGTPVTGVTLKTWRAPSGDGVYMLENDELKMVRTFTDVKYETKLDDETMKVAYPYMKPTKLSYAVEPGDWFVLSGQSNLERLKFRPLIADPDKRTFVDGSIADHAWVGVKFASDTEWEPVEAQLDESKIKSVQSNGRTVKYYPHDALPEGRYAIFGDKDQRMFIIDFGKSQNPTDAPAAGGEGE
ncbi:MAG: hypothetical protein H6742_21605 [Alphaproteobacteria bacterium]|nr:hypothetical protein [Alphaproteobacteria bacterium]